MRIKQGEDVVLTVMVYDKNNRKVDLTLTDKLRAALYVKGRLAFKYSDPTRGTVIPGYGEMSVNALDSSAVDILITREQSRTFDVGQLVAYIIAEYADLPLAGRAEEYTATVGVIETGYLKDEDLNL